MTEKALDLIEPEQFPTFLKGMMGTRSVADFAVELGVHPKLLYYLISGERTPSKQVLEKTGLRIVYKVVPRKPKK